MADSLWHVLHTSELTSKERIDIYRLLSDCYGSYDTYRTIACLKKGLEIAEREKMIKYIPHFTRTLGVYYDEHVAPGLAQHLDAHRPEESAQKGVHAPRSDDDEIGLGLNGDEGEGGDGLPLDDDALGQVNAALDGDIARLG